LLNTDELLRALRRFHANLNPAGHLIFDMITDRPPWQGPKPLVERLTGPNIAVVRITRWDPRRSIQTALVSISRNGRSHREVHVQRGYPVAVVVGLLAQARFNLLGAHDLHALGPAMTWTPRTVYVARKLFG
jgi:hypothetical protein